MHRRTSLLLCLLSATTALAILEDSFHIPSEYDNKTLEICDSEECEASADRIFKSIDFDVDPCTDFYQFACGGYIKNHSVSGNSTSIQDQSFSLTSAYDDITQSFLRILVEEKEQNSFLEDAKNRFSLCLEEYINNFPDVSAKSARTFCLRKIVYFFKWILGSGISDEAEEISKITKVQKMLDNIKVEFAKMVNKSEWMDDASKKASIDKAKEVNATFGLEASFLFTDEKVLNVIAKNSVYAPDKNSIAVLPAALNPPFLGMGLEALDYGAMGVMLGHELANSYATFSRDKHGNFQLLWTHGTVRAYFNITYPLVDQYSKEFAEFVRLRKDINAYYTLDEDLADNAGLRAAYRAYLRQKNESKIYALKNLEEYTNERLFFLSYANLFCSSESVEFTEKAILTRLPGYSPFRFRVNEPLKNFGAFSQAWGCNKTSEMYLKKSDRRKIW